MKRLILRFNTGGSLPGVKSKIIALLAADEYNVTHALKVLSDCQKTFLTYSSKVINPGGNKKVYYLLNAKALVVE